MRYDKRTCFSLMTLVFEQCSRYHCWCEEFCRESRSWKRKSPIKKIRNAWFTLRYVRNVSDNGNSLDERRTASISISCKSRSAQSATNLGNAFALSKQRQQQRTRNAPDRKTCRSSNAHACRTRPSFFARTLLSPRFRHPLACHALATRCILKQCYRWCRFDERLIFRTFLSSLGNNSSLPAARGCEMLEEFLCSMPRLRNVPFWFLKKEFVHFSDMALTANDLAWQQSVSCALKKYRCALSRYVP